MWEGLRLYAGRIFKLHEHLDRLEDGVQITKGETLTEWRDRPLTPQQIRYAFDDVRYLLPVWDALAQRLGKLGRLDWAREEFARLAAVAGLVHVRAVERLGECVVGRHQGQRGEEDEVGETAHHVGTLPKNCAGPKGGSPNMRTSPGLALAHEPRAGAWRAR